MTDPFAEPWVRGPLHLTREVADAIEAHAAEAYPSECCGFLIGDASDPARVDEARREPNEADRYHAMDPDTFPRTSATYFKIHELRASRTFTEGAQSGRPVKAIYHSHCDAGAYFSAEDTDTFSQAGTLMWPCSFIVISVMQGEPKETKLWIHCEGEDRFESAPMSVDP